MDLKKFIRDVPDFPKKGILFRDITPLLRDQAAFRHAIHTLRDKLAPLKPDAIAGIESRGFLFGTPLASEMGLGFVPIRKPGKLPWRTNKIEYVLEYGKDAVEVHQDALAKGEKVVLIDDLLATGGTAAASVRLLAGLGANVVGCAFVIELQFLNGRKVLAEALGKQAAAVTALVAY